MQSFFFGALYFLGGALCLTAAAFLLTVTVSIVKVLCAAVRKKDYASLVERLGKKPK